MPWSSFTSTSLTPACRRRSAAAWTPLPQAHRVLGAGHEEHGQVLGHLGGAGRRGDLAGEVGQRRIAACGEHRRRTSRLRCRRPRPPGRSRQPVEGRAGVLDLLGEGAGTHAVEPVAARVLPFGRGDATREEVPRFREGARLVARAAQDGAGKPLSVARQIGAGHETAHGMAEQEIRRLPGVARRHRLAQRVHVVDEDVLAALYRQASPFLRVGHALAVAHMVVSAHHVALRGQKPREVVVAADVFGHAVDDLNDAHGRRGATARLSRARGTRPILLSGFSRHAT